MSNAIDPANSNSHIWEYLKYYLSFSETPRFAVLLNGPWGIGKTHLVKKILNAHFDGWQDQWIYVSLYGVSNMDQLNEAVFAAIYPSLSSWYARLFGLVSTSALKKFGVDFKASPKLFLSSLKKKPYVFDDLERCNLAPDIVLGYINTFVEHEGCKVLILAHEEEIYRKEGTGVINRAPTAENESKYRAQREKVIGRTLEINSPLGEAFNLFISKVRDEPTKRFLEMKYDIVREMCNQAKLVNLRVIQQTIWDYERLFSVLTDNHRNHDEAMIAILRLFFAISFELKRGVLTAEDVAKRETGERALFKRLMKDKADSSKLEDAQLRYPGTDLRDEVLSNDVLVDTLTRGVIDTYQIRDAIDKSRFFVAVTNQPAWLVLWKSIEQTDVAAQKATDDLEEQFKNRSFSNHVELLQAFGLRLWLVDLGALSITRQDVLNEGKALLEELYQSGKLHTNTFPPLSDLTLDKYIGGHEVYQHDTDEFKQLSACYKDLVNRTKIENYPAEAHVLLNEMGNDPELYSRRISYTNSSENIYALVPILASINPDEFVTKLLEQPPLHQKIIFEAFRMRYQYGALRNDLATEQDWLRSVHEKLLAFADSSPPFTKNRIRKLTEWNITEYLSGGQN